MFVKDKSASEIGTSRASMNRTGKYDAAKGVQTNYNGYKDFHSRELEAQPRTQACSRYPSDQRRLGTERDSARPGKKWQKSPRSARKSPR